MFIYFVALSFCQLFVAQEDPCKFSTNELYQTKDIVECLKVRPWNKDQSTKTVKAILAMLGSMPFRDIFYEPPAGYQDIKDNIVERLQSVPTGTYEKAYDADQAIAGIVNRQGISQMEYIPGCTSDFAATLPFDIEVSSSDDSAVSSDVTLTFKAINDRYTERYKQDGFDSLDGLTIVHIVPPKEELDDIENETPYDTICRWGDVFFKQVLSPGTRFQLALHYFVHRSEGLARLPAESLSVTVNNKGTVQTVEVPYYATAPNAGQLSDFCEYSEEQTSSSSDTDRIIRKMLAPTHAHEIVGDDVTPQEMLKGSKYPAYSIDEWKMVYANLAYEPTTHGYNLFDMIYKVKQALGNHHIVLDMRGGKGLDETEIDALFSLLFPSEYLRYHPIQTRTTGVMVSYLKEFYNNKLNILTTPLSFDPLEPEGLNRVTREYHNQSLTEPKTNELFAETIINHDRAYDIYLHKFSNTERTKRFIRPQNLTILTDFNTAPQLADFIYHVKEKNLARVVTVGKTKKVEGVEDVNHFSIAPLGMERTIDANKYAKLSTDPYPFGWTGEGMKIPVTESHPTDWANRPKPEDPTKDPGAASALIWNELHPDFVIGDTGSSPLTTAIDTNLLDKLRAIFDTCADWEVDRDDTCTPEVGTRIAHGLYGHQCLAGQFTPSTCVLYGCEDGFYWDANKDCIPVQKTPDSEICNTEDRSVWPHYKFQKCLGRLPSKDDDENKETINIVKEYLHSYVLIDSARFPPQYFDEADVIRKLEAIASRSITDGYTYHYAIAEAVASLHDANTLYTIPCSDIATFAIPVQFHLEKVSNQFVLSMLPSDYKRLNEYWQTYYTSVPSLSEVTYLKFPDLEEKEGETPAETLGRWAEKFVVTARNPAQRLALALSTYLNSVSPSLYKPPFDEDKDQHIIVRGKETADSEEIELEIPWLTYEHENLDDILNNYCPPMQSDTVSSRRNSEAEIMEQEKEAAVAKLDQLIATQQDDPILMRICKYMKSNPEKYDRFITSLQKSKRRMSIMGKHKLRMDNLLRNNARSISSSPSTDTDLELITSPEVTNVVGYYSAKQKTVYMHVADFQPEPENAVQYSANVLKCISKYVTVDENDHYLVLDMRNSGEGFDELGAALMHSVFPAVFPFYARLVAPSTKLGREFIEVQRGNDGLMNPLDLQTYKSVDEIPTFSSNVSLQDAPYIQTFAGPFSYDFNNMVDEWKDIIPPELKDYYIPPIRTLVLSDGTCTGLCAQFVKAVKELNLAKVIGMGGAVVNTSVPFDIAAYPGGDIFSSDDIDTDSLQDRPANFSRASTVFQFGIFESITTDLTKTTFSDYEIITPDETIPVYENMVEFGPDKVQAVLDQTLFKFQKCYAWEVAETECKPSGVRPPHSLFGWPCKEDGSGWDSSKCVFSRCRTGYYRNASGVCDQIPRYPVTPTPTPQPSPPSSPEPPTEGGSSNKGFLIVVILIVVGSILTAIGIIAFFVWRKRSVSLYYDTVK